MALNSKGSDSFDFIVIVKSIFCASVKTLITCSLGNVSLSKTVTVVSTIGDVSITVSVVVSTTSEDKISAAPAGAKSTTPALPARASAKVPGASGIASVVADAPAAAKKIPTFDTSVTTVPDTEPFRAASETNDACVTD